MQGLYNTFFLLLGFGCGGFFCFILAKQQGMKGWQPNSGLFNKFDFYYQRQNCCPEGEHWELGCFLVKKRKKAKATG